MDADEYREHKQRKRQRTQSRRAARWTKYLV